MRLLADLPPDAVARLEEVEVVALRLNRVLGRVMPVGIATFTGADLRAARRMLGLTGQEAAEVIGCHINTIYNTEEGKTVPNRAHVRRAMAAFIHMADSRIEA